MKGQKYHDFEVIRAVEIPELQCLLVELIHAPTGAQVMHLANEDPENLFCLSFQTLPYSSNGIAHILEHTVLCGSEKFPVRDPFFSMNRRSLNTFMNALTGTDFTCYPASSQVPKDFYNLLEVYLDAVFKPNLKRLSFMQEGHRLEFSNPLDPSTPLEYRGVVFNEMKGAMSSPNSRISEALNHALFPDITYGFNSGGDPKSIPSLTYEELCRFHEYYYHPSHCLFFFYGNLPLTDHLDMISKNALEGIEKIEPLKPIPLQPRFEAPRRSHATYPISSDEDLTNKTIIAFGWLTCNILEQHEVLALSVIEIVLLDTDASPLKLALLKSGLCKQVSAYLESDISEIPTVIVLRGCAASDADSLESLIMETLESVVQKGIPLEMVENAMHQLEFHRCEITGDQAPFGLSLFMRSALLQQHGVNPEEGLKIHTLFEGLRKRLLEDGNYLTNLIKKYFIHNTHFVRIVMDPDPSLEGIESAEERAALDKIRASLSEEEAKKIVAEAQELAASQEKQDEEDLEILPKVALEDIPKYARNYPLTDEKIGNLKVFHHTCFTNDIIYTDLVYDLPEIKAEDLYLVRLFVVLLNQMGCGGRSYAQNLDYIQAHIGGIGASLTMNLQARNFHEYSPSLSIRGKALHRKAKKLFSLLYDMVTSVDFTDIHRLKEVIHKHFVGLENSLTQSPLKYAINLSSSKLTSAAMVSNAWYGLDYYWKIQEITQNIEHAIKPLSLRLEEMKKQLLGLENPHLILSCDSKTYNDLKDHHFYELGHLDIKPFAPWKNHFVPQEIPSQGRVISAPVAFMAKAFSSVSYVDRHAPALSIAAFLFDNLTLHTRLREQGGAYGGGASSHLMWGNFYFYSYRDPNIESTLAAFQEAIREVAEGNFDESDLEEAKLEMIQGLDSPVAPGSRADVAYGWLREGKTLEMRQNFRDRMLALTQKDIIDAVREVIIPNFPTGTTVVFAGKELLEKENAILIEKGEKAFPIESI